MQQSSKDGGGVHLLTLFLCGDVMTGRGIDQVLPHPGKPQLYEPYIRDARDYVRLAERVNGSVNWPVEPAYPWGAGLAELDRARPDVRIINLETAITVSDRYRPKGINYRMHPANIDCLMAADVDCCVLANNHVLAGCWCFPVVPRAVVLAGDGRPLTTSLVYICCRTSRWIAWSPWPDRSAA
jgi:poly-gamma-glutamate synthesis protein (capsule biosynthesis protein)